MSLRGASQKDIDQTMARLNYTTNLIEAVKDADLISESVPENLEIKKGFYLELAKVAPAKTIFTTNTSTLLPSQFAEDTGRPEKFLALHFANWIWDANIGEIMGHPDTDPEVFKRVIEFAKEIGMVPIPIYKEQNGYIINSLLAPLLSAAGNLLINKVADYETIDKTWMITSGVKMGPCGIMDMVGLETIYNIEKHWGEQSNDQSILDRADYYKKNFIDKGKLGMKTGEGFYTYPNPTYKEKDFLK
jgi:3-hydroxybutyryl-CoA dehydrogenase